MTFWIAIALSLSEQIVNLFDLIWQKTFEFIGNFQFFDFLKYKKSIGEITKLTRGNGKLTKKFIEKNPGKFPVYSGSTINNGEIGKISTYDFEGEFLTWTIDGYAGTVFYRNEKFSANSHCGIIEIKDQKIVNPKFLQYILQTVTPKFVNFDATIPSLSMEKMKKIEVLIPAKIIQNKISLIFSLFEKTINNVEEEIKLLEKQYHFYRNLIFDKFKIL
ncbi:restriction endonuclease subunit S [Mesomycoplasma dispar]|uniref:restriction endonuclease subunit S n=1 Tax=Mesomycoplasma dispar TaxID=86660 RepID=UPI0012FD89DE|nr:restriction endonuclease subunit S [Mesomycoplasma dispar]